MNKYINHITDLIKNLRRRLESIRFLRIGRGLYWLRSHTYNRYHIINISGMADYKWGWIDTDHKIELAVFRLFEEFMEGEYLNGTVDWDWSGIEPDDYTPAEFLSEQRAQHQEMKDIYQWWKFDRLEENKVADSLLEAYGDEYVTFKRNEDGGGTLDFHNDNEELALVRDIKRILDETLAEKETKMLHRIIDIRGKLWT